MKKSVNQEKEFEEEMANFERETTECYSVQVEEHNQRSFEKALLKVTRKNTREASVSIVKRDTVTHMCGLTEPDNGECAVKKMC